MSVQFLNFFSDPAPALGVKYGIENEEEEAKMIHVQHRLGSLSAGAGLQYLESLGRYVRIRELVEFYRKHDGAELCKIYDARYNQERPTLELKSASNIEEFTKRYMPGGDRAWTIDLYKSKAMYRSSAAWIAFAEVDSGPACLTIFLDGDNAGWVYYLTPQPQFNILRPIAKGFQPLLDRIAKDLPAFLRLIRARVSMRGTDGSNYGFAPIEYLANANERVMGLRATDPREVDPPR